MSSRMFSSSAFDLARSLSSWERTVCTCFWYSLPRLILINGYREYHVWYNNYTVWVKVLRERGRKRERERVSASFCPLASLVAVFSTCPPLSCWKPLQTTVQMSPIFSSWTQGSLRYQLQKLSLVKNVCHTCIWLYLPPNVDRRDWTSSLGGKGEENCWFCCVLTYPSPGPCSCGLFLLELSETTRERERERKFITDKELLCTLAVFWFAVWLNVKVWTYNMVFLRSLRSR